MNMNGKQLEAVHVKDGACAVIASAGSGKSTVLTERTRYLVQECGVKEEDILILSFTAPAKANMIEKLSGIGINNVTIHTFHSLSMSIMSKELRCCTLFDKGGEEGRDTYAVTRKFRENAKLTNAEVNNIFSFIKYQKKYGISYLGEFVNFEMTVSEYDMRKYFKIYEDYKTNNGLTDFDDWLNTAIEILKENGDRYTTKYLMIDEHQDSNLIQNRLIKLLCPLENIFCVFDFRQAIYGFTGANPEYCMNFSKDYKNVKVINLNINYRSTNNIVQNSNAFIRKYYSNYEHYTDAVSNNKDNGNIQLFTSYSKEDEAVLVVSKIEELLAIGEDPNDICILYRINSHSDYIIKLLKEKNIDYNIKNNGSFFKRKEVNLVISVLKLIENTDDDQAFESLYSCRAAGLNMMSKKDLTALKAHSGKYNLNLFQSLTSMKFETWQKRNISSFIDNIEKLRLQKDRKLDLSVIIENIYKLFDLNAYIKVNWSGDQIQERLDSLTALKIFAKGSDINAFLKFANGENKDNREDKDGIRLRTVYRSKGLEFKNVFVVGIEDGKFPHERAMDMDEEARVFYVAITRAKENLWLSQLYEENKFINEYFNK